MKISDVISLVGTIVLIITLFELIKQRRLSYKPKPLPVIRFFYLQIYQDIPALWKYYYEDFFDKNKMPDENSHYIEFYNGGLGPALELKYRWIMNEVLIEKMLIEFDKDYHDIVEYNESKKNLILKSSNRKIEYDLFRDRNEFNILNIPSMSENNIKIYLPTTYVVYLSLLAYLKIKKEEKNEVEDSVGIKCEIKYKDTGSKKYKEKYEIKAKLFDYSGWIPNAEQKNMNFAVGEFNFIRKIK